MMRWQVIRTFTRYWWVLVVLLILLVIRQIFKGDSIDYKSFKGSLSSNLKCESLNKSHATIDTLSVYTKLNFEPPPSRSFWNDLYEKRSQKRANESDSNPLKVFILPHSHNDPGWLRTFVNYFDSDTKKILDLIVEKLTLYNEMTFVWTEISFLDLWWKQASDAQREGFKKLVSDGRLDIMTGGWVMTDEANSHYHAMLDQLIEGHQWVKKNLNFIPKSAWSIDPFGQGSTVPHLLASSGLSGAIIQRIHYSWKEYFAWNQSGDFYWKPLWNNKHSSQYTILTHNMPFDIYSTKHSCGPHPEKCLQFEFRKVPGAWVESRAEDITDENVEKFADILVKQYQDTASLFSHNVAFVLVGGDFTYNVDIEFEQQYVNYKKLIDFVNSHGERYKNAKLKFGTPTEYFEEISKRTNDQFPTLKGDFFPYSDIFSSGTPAWWTGYFTTRPYHKMMSRNLEHNLRNAEILYTIAYNTERHLQLNFREARKLEKDYELIVEARRNLGLFQHHDAITGTSKKHVTEDYLARLLLSIKATMKIQQNLIESILQLNEKNRVKTFLVNELEHESIHKSPKKKIIDVKKEEKVEIFIFNSLAQDRVEAISLHVSSANVKVTNSKGYEMSFQVNQVLGENFFELIFIPKLSALSINSFVLSFNEDITGKMGQISSSFSLENERMVLTFNETSGYLSSIFDKLSTKGSIVKINFGAYKSTMRDSGAYLMKFSNEISNFMADLKSEVVVTKGPIAEDVTIIRDNFLTHKVRIFNSKTHLDDAISIVNDIDFGPSNKNSDVEMFMKIKTSIKNGLEPEFYTDQNGFHWQHRKKVPTLGIEANYFPITTCAFMQDNTTRLSLMTTHAQGAASINQGELEVMLDRRTSTDDGRGMGEGVYDSIKMQHCFYLTLEYFNEDYQQNDEYQMPSLLVQHMTNALNYPANIFITDKLSAKNHNEIELLRYKIPCDHHLVNFRTLTDDELDWLPSQSALLIIHKFGHACELKNEFLSENICGSSSQLESIQLINGIKVIAAEKTSLTALKKNYRVEYFNEPLDAMEIRTYNITFG